MSVNFTPRPLIITIKFFLTKMSRWNTLQVWKCELLVNSVETMGDEFVGTMITTSCIDFLVVFFLGCKLCIEGFARNLRFVHVVPFRSRLISGTESDWSFSTFSNLIWKEIERIDEIHCCAIYAIYNELGVTFISKNFFGFWWSIVM